MFALIRDNRAFRYATIVVVAQFLVMTVISVFRIGGDDFVSGMFDYIAPVYAIVATLALFWAWKTSGPKGVIRSIWGWMTLSLLIWTIAELLWTYYAIQSQEAIPSPSLADYVWIVGYVPMLLALFIRMRSFQVNLTRRQTTVLVISSAVFIILGALIIIPNLILNADPAGWQETSINVFYTVGNLLIVWFSLGIFYIVQRGRLSLVWKFILAANIISAVSDLLYFYASLNEDALSKSTFYAIYVAYNIPYLSSYLLTALGMLANQFTINTTQQDTSPLPGQAETNSGLVLLFTNVENKIVGASQNFTSLAGVVNVKELSGRPLHELLGIEPWVVANLMEAGGKKGYISSYPVEIRIAGHDHLQASITAISDKSSADLFNGLNIVMRVQAHGLELAELDAEFETIAQRILTDTGQTSRDNITNLNEYFKAQVLGLYRMVTSLGGSSVAQTMMDGFNRTARNNNWNIEFRQKDIFVPPIYTEEQLGQAFSLLLKDIKDYAADVVNAQVVADEIMNIEHNLNSRTNRAANDFGLRDL
jgi:hypothetical protein